MASFYSGKGGAKTSSFSSSSFRPSTSASRGAAQSYFSSIGRASAPASTSGLFGKPEPVRPTSSFMPSRQSASDLAWNQRMATQRASQTWNLGSRPGGNSLEEAYARMQSGNANFPIVGSKPEGSVVGSTGSRGTTYIDPKTGAITGFKLPPRGSNAQISYSGGGGGGMMAPSPESIEFSFGPPPEMKPLEIDYNKFKDVLLQTQLDPSKVRELSSQYNMSGEDFQKLVASFNPTEAQIGSAISLINDPGRLNAIAEGLNRPYREAFERAMPMYEQNMGLANALANQYLRGQISSDVESAVMRNAATQRMQTGLFGQGGLGRNIAPRDLGLTSLDLQARGANLLAQTGQLATQILQATMPVSGREFAISPTAIYESMRVSPTALLNATYIPASEIFRAYTVPATQVFDTYVSQAQYNQQIANQNLLNAWQGQTLPGQFVPGRGFLNFDNVTYTQTRPPLPGTEGTRRPVTNWRGIRA